MKKDLRAFTISEIAVALAVIAFVVMVTIPISRKKFEKVRYMQYYKAYELAQDMSKRLNNYSVCNQTFLDLTGKCIKAIPVDELYDAEKLYNAPNYAESLGYTPERLDLKSVALHYCQTMNPENYRLVNSNELKEIINYIYYGYTDLSDWTTYQTLVHHPNDNKQNDFYKSEPTTDETARGYYFIRFLSSAYPGLNNMTTFYSGSGTTMHDVYSVPNTTDYASYKRYLTFGYSRDSEAHKGISYISLNNATDSQLTFNGETLVYASPINYLRNSDLLRQIVDGSESAITTKKMYMLATGNNTMMPIDNTTISTDIQNRLRSITDTPVGSYPGTCQTGVPLPGLEGYYSPNPNQSNQEYPLKLHLGNQTPFKKSNPTVLNNSSHSSRTMLNMLRDWRKGSGGGGYTCRSFLDTDSPYISGSDSSSTFKKYRVYKFYRYTNYGNWYGTNASSSDYTTYYTGCDYDNNGNALSWDMTGGDQYCKEAKNSNKQNPLYRFEQYGIIHSVSPVVSLTNGTTTPLMNGRPIAFCRFESLDQ